jgi:hypothetical protein
MIIMSLAEFAGLLTRSGRRKRAGQRFMVGRLPEQESSVAATGAGP